MRILIVSVCNSAFAPSDDIDNCIIIYVILNIFGLHYDIILLYMIMELGTKEFLYQTVLHDGTLTRPHEDIVM